MNQTTLLKSIIIDRLPVPGTVNKLTELSVKLDKVRDDGSKKKLIIEIDTQLDALLELKSI